MLLWCSVFFWGKIWGKIPQNSPNSPKHFPKFGENLGKIPQKIKALKAASLLESPVKISCFGEFGEIFLHVYIFSQNLLG